MKKALLTCCVLCFTAVVIMEPARAVRSNVVSSQAIAVSPFNQGVWQALYPTSNLLQKAASPEAREAYEKLTSDQRQFVREKVAEITSSTLRDSNSNRPSTRISAQQMLNGQAVGQGVRSSVGFSDQFNNKRGTNAIILESKLQVDGDLGHATNFVAPPRTTDKDLDGLSDTFEVSLAEAFTPYYYVSGGESNNFATFYNFPPLRVAQTWGPYPLSHYRVKPLGFISDPATGQQYCALKIDYMTLWDRDNGLIGNPSLCGLAVEVFDRLKAAHEFDVERSAVLVYAPTTALDQINYNVSAYGARLYYTAAHEGESLVDRSLLIYVVGAPMPAYSHISLALSRSKHATYPFDPDGMPLLPASLISAVLDAIYLTCLRGFGNGFGLGDVICLAALYEAYRAFFGCATEKWTNIGGRYANPVFNVGEPTVPNVSGTPLSCCLFIEDDSVRALRLKSKLVNPITNFCPPGGACF